MEDFPEFYLLFHIWLTFASSVILTILIRLIAIPGKTKKYAIIFFIWLIFIIGMSLAVLMRIIDTPTYLLYSLVLFYIFYILAQVSK